MTRNLPWLAELQPEMFVEMSEELAAELGIENGERVKVRSQRGEVDAVAIVTKRFKPYKVRGEDGARGGLALALGLQGSEDGQQRQPADALRRRCQYGHPGDQGVPLQSRQGIERR